MQNSSTTGFDFWGGVSNVGSGIADTFNVLLDGAMKFENYKSQRDANGASQGEIVNAVTKPTNTNAYPISAAHYNTVATGETAKTASPVQGVNSQTLIYGAIAVGLLMLVVR